MALTTAIDYHRHIAIIHLKVKHDHAYRSALKESMLLTSNAIFQFESSQ